MSRYSGDMGLHYKQANDLKKKRLEVEYQVTAVRLVLKNLKDYIGKENALNPSALKWAKMLTRKQIEVIILELSTHHQVNPQGTERLEFWKNVKLYINQV